MKVLKTLALVGLATLGTAAVQADEPVKTMPQTGVSQATYTYTDTGRSHKLFSKNRTSNVVQTSGSTQQTTPATTAQSSTTTTVNGKTTTTVTSQPVTAERQHRGLFSRHRSSRTTTPVATTTTATTSSSSAKPMPLGK